MFIIVGIIFLIFFMVYIIKTERLISRLRKDKAFLSNYIDLSDKDLLQVSETCKGRKLKIKKQREGLNE